MQTIQPADESTPPATRLAGKVALPTIRLAAILGLLATAALLGVVSATAGLGIAGWIVGLATGSAATALLATARMRSDQPAIHPADWVTLTRMLLIAGVAGLVADSFSRPVPITALVTLSAVALVLDAVDGQVARRTGTATPLGARLDGEVDAFLILLLSIIVARDYGGWVLVIGAARYALLLAGWLIPWLAAPLPPRYWRKVVAAVQGIVLTVAASGVPSRLAGMIAVAAALLLLAESFGRDVIWLYRTGAGPRTRQALRVGITVLAVVLVWGDLIAPDRAWQFTPAAFVRIPVEALVLVAVALVLPPWPRRIVAAIAGILFGLLTLRQDPQHGVLRGDRPGVQPGARLGQHRPALGVVRDAIGTTLADVVLVALGLGLILLVVAITASAIHITTVAARHRRGTVRGARRPHRGLGAVRGPVTAARPGIPGRLDQRRRAGRRAGARHPGRAPRPAPFRAGHPQPRPRGQHPRFGPADRIARQGRHHRLRRKLRAGRRPGHELLAAASTPSCARAPPRWPAPAGPRRAPGSPPRPSAGSAGSPTPPCSRGCGSTPTSGMTSSSAASRFTLSDAFDKAGWHTVSDDPSDDPAWPPGKSFYHYDQLYNRYNVGYHGPNFSYASMPDQYTLAEFQRHELAPGHKPVMAEIDLVSSHTPWAPLPSMVPWNKVGNGSIFDPMPAQSESAPTVWRNANTVRQFYGQSIQYSLQALTSWVTELNDPNLVLILLGDHQPHTTVSGAGANHEVPISIVARDPSVFKQIAPWHWQDGLLPGPSAPLEPMDAFRNQFLGTFSTASSQAASAHGPAAPEPPR